MLKTEGDKLTELHRYDVRAQSQLSEQETSIGFDKFGACSMPRYLQTPYIFYERCVAEYINADCQILELGAGSGLHTWTLVKTGAQVTAIDISTDSLRVLKRRINIAGWQVSTQVADIESLPFAESTFDVVVCAGSLSYGEPSLVDAEIKRVLRPNGMFICVDSLNHNPIYRMNRWLHYLRGNRTKSTLQRMPTISRINSLSNGFSVVSISYFGSVSFAMPVIALIGGEKRAQAISDYFDRMIGVRRSAFKFVLVAKGLRKAE